jgi:ABC-type polysaccharide/polyol phosphate export permease
MLSRIGSLVMWVGRATVFLVGLAVLLAGVNPFYRTSGKVNSFLPLLGWSSTPSGWPPAFLEPPRSPLAAGSRHRRPSVVG